MLAEREAQGKERKNKVRKIEDLKKDIKINKRNYTYEQVEEMIEQDLKHKPQDDTLLEKMKSITSQLSESVSDILSMKTTKGKLSRTGKEIKESLYFISDTLDYSDEEKRADLLSSLNKEAQELQGHREAYTLPDNATKAIYYNNLAEETIYGYDKGEPLTNLLKALPKKDRDYMQKLMKAPEEEHAKILELVPEYLKRPLQSAWGYDVSKNQDIDDYFSEHQLPGSDWAGWQENVSLDSVKVKMVKKEGQDFSEHNIWEDDVEKANATGEVPLPYINFRENIEDVRKRLYDVLNEAGIENVNINYVYTPSDIEVELDIKNDRRKDVEKKIENITI